MEEKLSRYKVYQPLIKTADIIEFKGNTALGWAIRTKTGMDVNHTSGVILYKMVGGTQVRRYVGESLEDGFNLHYLSDVLKGYDGKVYWSQLRPEWDYYRSTIAEEVLKLEGRKYGYKDIIKLLFSKKVKLDLEDPDPICSVAWQIALIKADLLDKNFNDGNMMVPGQFGLTGLFYSPIRIY